MKGALRRRKAAAEPFSGIKSADNRWVYKMEKKAKYITIADVARALGVSKTTVSRAISGKGRISEATRRRVMDYIEENDYKPNVIAKGLAQSKTFNLCVVMPEDYNLSDLPFFQQVIMGIQETAGQMEYDILLCIGKEHDTAALERVLTNRKVDGVILLRTYTRDLQIELLQRMEIPFVATGCTDYANVCQVDNDHKNACRELTGVLLGQGMKRIALLGGVDTLMVTQSRLRGYLDAYGQKGEKPDESLIFLNLEHQSAIDLAVNEAMEKQVDCILCMDDVICGYVLRKLRQDSRKIPEDVRLASFYNSSVLEYSIPSITSLSFNAKKLGIETAKILLDHIAGKEVAMRTLLPHRLLLRESTG